MRENKLYSIIQKVYKEAEEKSEGVSGLRGGKEAGGRLCKQAGRSSGGSEKEPGMEA